MFSGIEPLNPDGPKNHDAEAVGRVITERLAQEKRTGKPGLRISTEVIANRG